MCIYKTFLLLNTKRQSSQFKESRQKISKDPQQKKIQ